MLAVELRFRRVNGENLRTKRPVLGVCPSLPGYGFSDKPAAPGWGIERISDEWCELMARLGYRRFGAQGSDWGTSIATSIGQRQPDRVAGIHLMPPLAPPDPATLDDLTGAERTALATLREADEWGSGYSAQQSTRPQTVGYGLVDSPAALCAWIVEKFWSWTDSGGDLHRVITRDELLDNLMLYWLPGTGASSARLYWESLRQVNEWISGSAGAPVTVPTGCSVFPKELQRPSRRWAERRFPNIRYWNEPGKGGHVAAFEQPALFVDEVRSFFRLVR
ncbi:alpha/beta fold hydrolase [Amycolatopsis sp. lyj-109]|uniref:alpha/beta fold hydrolase n=1 Tax=Amycolatopsis sp. lyj-109 TaxID=2789287 RepID=UPI00397A9C9F